LFILEISAFNPDKPGALCLFIFFIVAAALKKMKMRKAPGLSGLTAEMIQSTGTQ